MENNVRYLRLKGWRTDSQEAETVTANELSFRSLCEKVGGDDEARTRGSRLKGVICLEMTDDGGSTGPASSHQEQVQV